MWDIEMEHNNYEYNYIDDSVIDEMEDNHFVFVSPNPVKITTYTDHMDNEFLAVLFSFCNSDAQFIYDFDFDKYNDKTIEWCNLNQISSSFEDEYGELLDSVFKWVQMDYVDEYAYHNNVMSKLDCLRFYYKWQEHSDSMLRNLQRGIGKLNRGLYAFYQHNFELGMKIVANKEEWLKKPFFVQ
jgi:hypothetical protein